MNHEPVLFLDIDGVLNSSDQAQATGNPRMIVDVENPERSLETEDQIAHANQRPVIHKAHAEVMARVLRETGAVVVFSTAWRSFVPTGFLGNWLVKNGIPVKLHRRKAATDKSWSLPRCAQIRAWLDEHPEVTCWAAVDDIDLTKGERCEHGTFPGLPRENCVIVDGWAGLQPAEGDRLIKMLTRVPA